MTFEELQITWQSQEKCFKLNISSEVILREVRHNEKGFRSEIFWRDVREVGVACALFAYFLYQGLKSNAWELLLLASLLLGVAAFLVVDRMVQRRRRPDFDSTLLGCVESSLAQVEHQIWLVTNVLWWYLLPLGIGVEILFCSAVWESLKNGDYFGLALFGGVTVFTVGLYWGIYRLNQYAVRKHLIPRKQELEELGQSVQNGAA